jgi:hypothetical protein
VSPELDARSGALLEACSCAFYSADPDNRMPFDETDFRAQGFTRVNRALGSEGLYAGRRFEPFRWRSRFVLNIDLEQ